MNKKESTRLEFFSHETQALVTPAIKARIEETFPLQHYGENIFIYEAWGMRHLLEQAMLIGFYMAKSGDTES